MKAFKIIRAFFARLDFYFHSEIGKEMVENLSLKEKWKELFDFSAYSFWYK